MNDYLLRKYAARMPLTKGISDDMARMTRTHWWRRSPGLFPNSQVKRQLILSAVGHFDQNEVAYYHPARAKRRGLRRKFRPARCIIFDWPMR